MWLTPLTALIAALASPLGSSLGVSARSAAGDRLLVVADKAVDRALYSSFFADLQGLDGIWRTPERIMQSRGFDITYKSPSDKGTDLFKYGERQYDHLILFAPEGNKALPASLSPQSILSAQLGGLNTLYLLPPTTSDVVRDFMREYDLELSDKSQTLVSPFTSSSSSSNSSSAALVPSDRITPFSTSGPVIPPSFPLSGSGAGAGDRGGSILYPAGSAHAQGAAGSPYLIPVLRAPRGAYLVDASELQSAASGEGDEAEVDKQLGNKDKVPGASGYGYDTLVSVFQTRDNARAGFVGSADMLSDAYWTGANADFARALTSWVFQETGVVRATATRHSRVGDVVPREQYTKMDNLTYSLHVSTFNPASATWEPFHLEAATTAAGAAGEAWSFQLDFTMLDPYVRTRLREDRAQETATEAVYTVDFQAPDRHGVFKFMVDWYRPGYSFISVSDTASVVPLRHDEYPRFVVGAYPYYAGTFSVSAAFLLFCGAWLMMGQGAGVARGNKGQKAE